LLFAFYRETLSRFHVRHFKPGSRRAAIVAPGWLALSVALTAMFKLAICTDGQPSANRQSVPP
jgi:hypothetical protein